MVAVHGPIAGHRPAKSCPRAVGASVVICINHPVVTSPDWTFVCDDADDVVLFPAHCGTLRLASRRRRSAATRAT